MATLQGRVALVAGVGPNIGIAIARTLAEAGASVVCFDRSTEIAAQSAGVVVGEGGRSVGIAGDVANPSDVDRALDEAEQAFGLVDALVCNAARPSIQGILDVGVEEFDSVVSVGLKGPYVLGQRVATRLVSSAARGAIVNVASTSGHRGRRNALAYCAAKGGVLNMTRAMAIDLSPYGIRVNSVSPTKTGKALAGESKDSRSFGEIPLGRLGEPTDQALAVRYLLSDESAFITGEDIRVDGGSLATWGTRSYSGSSSGSEARPTDGLQ